MMRAADHLEMQQPLEGMIVEEGRAAGDMAGHVLPLRALADDLQAVVALGAEEILAEFEHRALPQALAAAPEREAARIASMIGS